MFWFLLNFQNHIATLDKFNFEPKVAKYIYEFFFFKAKKEIEADIVISFGTFLKKIVHSIVRSTYSV